MPIYEYRCERCEYTHEHLSMVVSDAPRSCPKCGKPSEITYSLTQFHDFNHLMKTSEMHPYVTNNIAKDGSAIEIRSHKQLEKECRKHGVTPAFGKENRVG